MPFLRYLVPSNPQNSTTLLFTQVQKIFIQLVTPTRCQKYNLGQQMAWNENPSEGAKRLALRTGCGSQFQLGSEKFVECLRNPPVQEIIDAAAEESFADFVWSPVVDGVFLPEPPTREYMNQKGLTDRFNFMITGRRIL